MKKRMLSSLLALCMMLMMVPVAFAAESLQAPTGLEWVAVEGTIPHTTTDGETYGADVYPWDIKWNRVENGTNRYEIWLIKDDYKLDSTTWSFDATDISTALAVDFFRMEPRESGIYKFTIQALGNGQDLEDGPTATSPEKTYTAPDAQLAYPTNLYWNGSTACWDAVEDADGYTIEWYYSKTATDELKPVGSTGFGSKTEIELEDWILTENGEGYYAFAIRAMSDDVENIRPSVVSPISDRYSTSDATTSVSDALDNILGSLDNSSAPEDISDAVSQVKQLDTDELRVAMDTDNSDSGINSKIQELEKKTGITVTTAADDELGLDENLISLTGAALNAAEKSQQVTFNISKPDQNMVVEGAYANAVQFDFQMNGVEPTDEFAVPIKITMPLPGGIDSNNVRILHYTANGTLEEIVFPYVFEKEDTYYASFVVTHFSTFVFANVDLQEAIDEATPGDTIKLMDDVALTDGIEIDKAITLDLNGKTIEKADNGWTTDSSVDYLLAVKRGGDLTIKDSAGSGKIDAGELACGVKMTIKGEDENGNVAALTVNGGMIQGKDYGIAGNGTRHGTEITINGGTITAAESTGTAIYHPQDGSLTVNGGEIKSANTAIEIRSGTLTVTGGTITGGSGTAESTANGGGTTTSNAAVAIAQHTTKKPITVNITGGTLSGGAALYESDPNNIYTDVSIAKPAIEVTGGTFNGAVSSNNVTGFIAGGTFSETVDEELLAEGWKIENGTAVTEPDNIFAMQDFNLWGDGWKGAFNVGWKFQEDFDTDRITGLEVGMIDVNGKLIVKYTATGDQLTYQRENGYISNGGQSSAPFYKEYEGTPIKEGEDQDWTVTFGEAFDKWDAYSCYVTVTVGETEYTLTNTCTHQHTYDLENVSDAALKSAATTSSPAIYYKTCSICGAISSSDANTFEYGSAISGGGSSGGSGGSSSSSYMVSVASGIDNGKVTVSPKSASKGDTITITVTPDEGYELDTLTVTDKNGDKISVTDKGNGKYTFTMPSGKVTIDAAFTEVAETPDQVGPFEDVSTADWFADAVQYMLDNGMMNGVSENTFAPNTTTTRGMIVTMLHRLEGEPSAAASAFTDVAAGSYYADAVAWAAANGIVDGVSETSFAPDKAITREQMAAILYRYAEYKGYDTAVGGMSLAEYTDADQISSYAVTAMQWANSEGLITGVTDTTLEPKGSATRAQVATILMRFCENITA